MVKVIIRVLNILHIIFVRFAQVLLVCMVVLTSANIFLRYVFNTGIIWSEEVSLLFEVWFIFISLGLGIKQKLHITISVLAAEKLPPKINFILDKIGEASTLLVGCVMIIFGQQLVGFTMMSIMPATGFPAGILYLVLPIAGLSIVIETLLHMLGADGRDAKIDSYLSGGEKLLNALGEKNA